MKKYNVGIVMDEKTFVVDAENAAEAGEKAKQIASGVPMTPNNFRCNRIKDITPKDSK